MRRTSKDGITPNQRLIANVEAMAPMLMAELLMTAGKVGDRPRSLPIARANSAGPLTAWPLATWRGGAEGQQPAHVLIFKRLLDEGPQ